MPDIAYETVRRVGETITQLREAAGLSQKEFAAAVEMSQSLISRLEKGNQEPGLSKLSVIAEFFGLTVGRLLDGEISRAGRLPGTESTDAKLRRAYAENDRLRDNEKRWAAELEHAEADIIRLRAERADIREALGVDPGAESLSTLDAARTLKAELDSVRESLDARTRALVRARAVLGEAIAQATPRHGTTLCPRCGDELAAEVAAENGERTP